MGPAPYPQTTHDCRSALPLRFWNGVRGLQHRLALLCVDQPDFSRLYAWAGTVYLFKQEHRALDPKPYRFGFLMALIPALFMTMVSVSYIFIAPEGFRFATLGISWIAYLIAAVVTISLLAIFTYWAKRYDTHR